MTTYTHLLDLANEAEPPADDRLQAVLFGFGQAEAVYPKGVPDYADTVAKDGSRIVTVR